MDWIKQRVWQLGIAIILALLASVIIYFAGVVDINTTLLWLGLSMYLLAMLIPLLAKIFEAVQEENDEEGET
jgi:hypothetical protein